MKPLSHYPIVLIGAGPVGMLCALSLHRQGQSVLLLEARAAGSTVADQRTIALSYHSVDAFRAAGVELDERLLTPISTVHVSRQHCWGRTLLRADDVGLPYLGATIDYAALLQQCEAALSCQQVPVAWSMRVQRLHTLGHWAEIEVEGGAASQTLTAQWVVLAEGGELAAQLPGIRRHRFDYRQMALVNMLQFDQPNQGTAYERFTDAGPLALLPYGRDFKLVWTCTPEEAQQRLHLDRDALDRQLQEMLGPRFGALRQVGAAAAFPLSLQQLNTVYSGRVICIGNAAQTMHPVAAQGLNLGVRDAAHLAQIFARSHRLDDDALARRYAASRRVDAHAIVGFTHALVMLFDHSWSWLQWGQGAGMALLGGVGPLRRAFTQRLVFGV